MSEDAARKVLTRIIRAFGVKQTLLLLKQTLEEIGTESRNQSAWFQCAESVDTARWNAHEPLDAKGKVK